MSLLIGESCDMPRLACRSSPAPRATCPGSHVAPHAEPGRHATSGMSLRMHVKCDIDPIAISRYRSSKATCSVLIVAPRAHVVRHATAPWATWGTANVALGSAAAHLGRLPFSVAFSLAAVCDRFVTRIAFGPRRAQGGPTHDSFHVVPDPCRVLPRSHVEGRDHGSRLLARCLPLHQRWMWANVVDDSLRWNGVARGVDTGNAGSRASICRGDVVHTRPALGWASVVGSAGAVRDSDRRRPMTR
jgi:hypothetical protein